VIRRLQSLRDPRRLLAAIGLTLISLFALIWLLNRSGVGSPYPSGDITLRLWTTEEHQAALEGLAQRYEKRHHNVKVEITHQPSADLAAALEAAAKAGATPDIYLASLDRVLRDPSSVATAPRRVLKADRVRRDFIPAVGETLTSGDSLYGLPLSVDNLALYYRKSAFEAAGLKPPATWNELLESIPKLAEKNGLSVERAAISLGTPLTDPEASLLQVLMAQNGAALASGGKVTWAEPDQDGYYPGVKALDFFTSFANPEKSSYTWSDALGSPPEAFRAGRTAAFIGTWSSRESLAGLGDDLGIAPLPAIRSDRPRNLASFSPYVVASSSPNVYAAWDFLRFATSERELGRYLETSGRLSPRLDLARGQARDGAHDAFASQLSSAHSWQLASYPETTRELHAAMTAVLTGRATSTQALQQAAAALQPLVK
jgi:ABC-type glycerol-3-phosphate transport system substrate-binding protein